MSDTFTLIVFWFSLLTIIYTYIGYPVCLRLFSIIFRHPVKRDKILPSVSLIVAAYNEEIVIGEKIKNSLSLDYPEDRLEIIVVSDRSTDKTDQIIKSFDSKRIRLLRTDQRSGKTGAQNLAITHASGEILVFSDATTHYEKDALLNIARNFTDESIGGAEGRLIYLPSDTGFLGNKDAHKSYEAKIKLMESNIWSGVGDNGAFYAIRKNLCPILREDLTSDFAAPLHVCRNHKRFVFDPEALSYEKAAPSAGDEFCRKIRTVRAGLHVFRNNIDLLNPFKFGWTSYVLLSRKLCRWLSSLMIPTLLISNVFLLRNPFYAFTFAFQMSFYVLVIIGIMLGDTADTLSALSIPKNFISVHLAAVAGILSHLTGKNTEVWTPRR